LTEEAKAEATVETIVKEPDPAPETKAPAKEPDGTDFVEIEDPKLAARFRRLYGHVKSLERGNHALVEHTTALQKKLEEITGLVETGQTVAATKQIKDQLVLAKQRGDAAAEVELTDRLTKVNATPRQGTQLPPPPQTETIELNEARQWESETDAEGNFLRPWAQPTHPRFNEAMALAKTLVGDPTVGADMTRVLSAIDKKMGLKTAPAKRPSASTVMSSDARPPRGELPDLTNEQLLVAKRMGIPPKDYATQLKLLNKGAAR